MKVALSIWNDHIAPVFDVSQQLVVLEIAGGKILARQVLQIGECDPSVKVKILADQHVSTLVCGAISRVVAGMVSSQSIHLLSYIAGDEKTITDILASGRLPDDTHMMPGCGSRRRRHDINKDLSTL